MERIKREILQAVTTGVTACTGTTGTCYVIIPDTGVTYHFIVGLTQDTRDAGFMDAYVTGISPYGGNGDPIGGDNLFTSLTVTTGTAMSTDKFYYFSAHEITDDGGEVVTRYGTLYTDDETYDDETLLVYENRNDAAITDLGYNDTLSLDEEIGETKTFGGKFFIDGTYVYYRAYAINADGIAYGELKSKAMPSLSAPVLLKELPEGDEPIGDNTTLVSEDEIDDSTEDNTDTSTGTISKDGFDTELPAIN